MSENPLYIHGSHPVGPRLLNYWSHGSHACGTKQDDLKNDLQHRPSASAQNQTENLNYTNRAISENDDNYAHKNDE